MNILMLSSTFPYPPDRGGTEIRTFNLLKHLHRSHSVTLVAQRSPAATDADVDALRQAVHHLTLFPLPAALDPERERAIARKAARWLRALWQGTPPNVLHRYCPAMQAWIDAHIQAGKCDVVACEHSVNEIYVRPQTRSIVRTVVDIHSSVYGWTRNHLETGASTHPLRDRFSLPLLHRYEKRYCTKFSHLVVTTEDDRQQMLRFRPDAPITVIPNGVDLALFPDRPIDPGGSRLVFVGAMDASHNIDAVRFFVLEVMPLLRQRHPAATFRIVGARPTAAVQALASQPGVTVTGHVPALVQELHRATVCVVPLRTGFGIKNKTLEAMAAGVPVVGSDRGLEGLAVDGAGVPLRALRANTAAEFVVAIDRLFTNPPLRAELSRQGRALVAQTYTWEQAGQQYERVLAQH